MTKMGKALQRINQALLEAMEAEELTVYETGVLAQNITEDLKILAQIRVTDNVQLVGKPQA